MPREFGQVFVTLIYIPPDANVKAASDIILDTIQQQEGLSADAPKFILGDFNACTLKDTLPHYYQYVTCHTRSDKTLDLCYGNIKKAYKSLARPPLGSSDHNSVYLLPEYKQRIKSVKPTEKTVKVWSTDSIEKLRGCFECTDWSVFEDTATNIDELTGVITDYTNFCVDTVIPCKTVKIFANNKPWISKELKSILNEKKRAFCARDKIKVKCIQTEINKQVKKCKQKYKDKIEEQFSDSNLKYAWSGLKNLIGATKKRDTIDTSDNYAFANDLNSFYGRFDCHDFSSEREQVIQLLGDDEPLLITEQQVVKTFNKINIRKASGPDGLRGVVLKECSQQLAPIFQRLFQSTLDSHTIPQLWKTSNVIPVPKKQCPKGLNDYRPVALTSIAMKCLERIIKTFLLQDTDHLLDPMQFAYRPHRGVEDATLYLLHHTYRHLDKTGSWIRMLFLDFSSAFNTIQAHLLLMKLKDMSVNTNIIKWVNSFMLDRPQYVSVNDCRSEVLSTATGAPQGCVISPILFILYTNDCCCNDGKNIMIKFADDTVLVGLLSDSEDLYRGSVQNLVSWCDSNFLHLNTSKTKEIVIDFSKRYRNHQPVMINNEPIEMVGQYKYLGTIIDSKLSWNLNTEAIYKKAQQRLYFLRRLRHFNVDRSIMTVFYETFVHSIMTFNILSWYGNITLTNKNKLNKLVNIAGKIVGKKLDKLECFHEQQALRKLHKILKDPKHPLATEFQYLPSGRRIRACPSKTNRTIKSFVPVAIRLYNCI